MAEPRIPRGKYIFVYYDFSMPPTEADENQGGMVQVWFEGSWLNRSAKTARALSRDRRAAYWGKVVPAPK